MIDMPMNQMMDMSTSGMMDMPMSRGPLVIMGKWMPSMNTMIMGYGGYFNNRKIPLAGISINQKFTNGSFGYAKRYRRSSGSFDNIMDYSELYAQFNLNMNLKLISKLKRDDRNSKNIESIVGLEYENCCLALRLTTSDKNLSRFEMNKEEIYYHHLADAWDNMIEIENKSRINFEFELKGLNSSLRKVNKLLNTSLLNY
jgi:lipopolysaccharide assembly outer membrane protein LptD (OstA)